MQKCELTGKGKQFGSNVHHDSLGLEIWLSDFLGVVLRKADIAAELLAFTGEFTSCCHN